MATTRNSYELDEQVANDIVTEEPKMYKVVLHNDHYTPMDFVIEVLQEIFHKSYDEATVLMLKIHKSGSGIAGIYTYDIAVTKVNLVMEVAKKYEYPFKASYEEA